MNRKLPKQILTYIDGVWTDGGMYYDGTNVGLNNFNLYDRSSVLFAHYIGIPVEILIGENTQIVQRRVDKFKVEYCFLRAKDKVAITTELCRPLGIDLRAVARIGDDLNDIKEIMLKVAVEYVNDNIAEEVEEQMSKLGFDIKPRSKVMVQLQLQDLCISIRNLNPATYPSSKNPICQPGLESALKYLNEILGKKVNEVGLY
ncbi:HAD family hydrolase [Bacteroides graminisolvens]|uniref:3-deoxy-D-manno-octulosonate 8-phosphate phosphatase n=1 Tax=Bacteroides graminisolvens DSM 19988 = JCM 15093 TaxID=1121097 RepID=A0A069D1G9_9BACE|nr:hypothetical protein [Bacteroides graminisolvens]GAK36096.1 3-deoxy-D-manno-octulosonate 8-phosphate phosphatase [Bacteroides graminisolvens DSM 19988 = JCM 15093]